MSEENQVVESDVSAPAEVDLETAESSEDVIAAENAETEEVTAEESAPQEKPKKPSRAERRINELTREKYEAQRRQEALEAELAQFRQQQTQQYQVTERPPSLADVGYDEEKHAQAVQQWHQSQLQSFQEQQEQAQRQMYEQQQAMQRQQMMQEKVYKAAEKYPDFLSKVNDPSLPSLAQVNEAAFEAMLESEHFEDVAYYLANNPQEIYRFHSMGPIQAVREITAIESKFNARPVETRVPPKPPSKVSGNSEATVNPDDLPVDEWIKWRNKQVHS